MVQFAFLATFSWLHVMCFDIWWTFWCVLSWLFCQLTIALIFDLNSPTKTVLLDLEDSAREEGVIESVPPLWCTLSLDGGFHSLSSLLASWWNTSSIPAEDISSDPILANETDAGSLVMFSSLLLVLVHIVIRSSCCLLTSVQVGSLFWHTCTVQWDF